MPSPTQLLFLPGASGNTRFWKPVADRLLHKASRAHMGWPGFGSTPAHAGVRGLRDLAASVTLRLDEPTALIAQSMGGVVALMAALEAPAKLTHLVLVATSGGVDVKDAKAADWRPAFRAANPTVPPWFTKYREDLSSQLGSICIPTLLIWGDADPISPVAFGARLASLLPNAQLHLIQGGDHDLAMDRADEVASLIDEFLSIQFTMH